MTRPPYVSEAAIASGFAAHVVDRILAAYLPPYLMAMDEQQRAEVIAFRDAVRRAADAYLARPRTDIADIPQTDMGASSNRESPSVTASEAAALLGITTRHARRLAAAGLGRKVAGRWVLNRDAVQDIDEYRGRRGA